MARLNDDPFSGEHEGWQSGDRELVTARLGAEAVAVLVIVRTRCFVCLALFGVCRQQVFCLEGSDAC